MASIIRVIRCKTHFLFKIFFVFIHSIDFIWYYQRNKTYWFQPFTLELLNIWKCANGNFFIINWIWSWYGRFSKTNRISCWRCFIAHVQWFLSTFYNSLYMIKPSTWGRPHLSHCTENVFKTCWMNITTDSLVNRSEPFWTILNHH